MKVVKGVLFLYLPDLSKKYFLLQQREAELIKHKRCACTKSFYTNFVEDLDDGTNSFNISFSTLQFLLT